MMDGTGEPQLEPSLLGNVRQRGDDATRKNVSHGFAHSQPSTENSWTMVAFVVMFVALTAMATAGKSVNSTKWLHTGGLRVWGQR
jgi:hypothetical protein